MNKVLLSIIFPVYNTDKFIIQSLNSIISQLDERSELIIVNDGSTDNSLNLINTIVRKQDVIIKDNIIIITQANQGLSIARNNGVKKSSGKYLLFIDSDDILINGSLNKILTIPKEEDIIVFNIKKFYDGTDLLLNLDNEKLNNLEFRNKNGHDALKILLKTEKRFGWYAVRYLLKREFIQKNDLYFIKGIIFEDVHLIPQIFLSSSLVSKYTLFHYGYRVNRPNSIISLNSTSNLKLDSISLIFSTYNSRLKLIQDRFLLRLFLNNISPLFVYLFVNSIKNGNKDYLDQCKNLSFMFNHINRRNHLKFKYIYKVLGFQKLVNVLLCFYKYDKKNN